MTEAEWRNNSNYSVSMLLTLRTEKGLSRSKTGRRKPRLLACGCAQLIWEKLSNASLRDAVEAARVLCQVAQIDA